MGEHDLSAFGVVARLREAADVIERLDRCLGEDSNRIAELEDRVADHERVVRERDEQRGQAEQLTEQLGVCLMALEGDDSSPPPKPGDRWHTVLYEAVVALRDRAAAQEADCREALQIGYELTLETQTVGEMAADLVRLVREARAQRDAHFERLDDATIVLDQYRGQLRYEGQYASADVVEKCSKLIREQWAATSGSRPRSASRLGRAEQEAPELPHPACGPCCDVVDDLVLSVNMAREELWETCDELEDVEQRLNTAQDWALRWKQCAKQHREGRARANAAVSGMLRETVKQALGLPQEAKEILEELIRQVKKDGPAAYRRDWTDLLRWLAGPRDDG